MTEIVSERKTKKAEPFRERERERERQRQRERERLQWFYSENVMLKENVIYYIIYQKNTSQGVTILYSGLTLYLSWQFWTLPIQQQIRICCQKY